MDPWLDVCVSKWVGVIRILRSSFPEYLGDELDADGRSLLAVTRHSSRSKLELLLSE